MWVPVDAAGVPVTPPPVQGRMVVERNTSGRSARARCEVTHMPQKLRDGRWKLQPMLVPIESSEHAPTREADEALWAAAASGQVALAEGALAAGARSNAPIPYLGHWTALHVATWLGHTDVMRYLLSKGSKASQESR